MDTIYLITPFFAWLVTGSTKFIVNSIRYNELAFKRIGYGGMPSNHSAIVSSAITQVGLQEGIYSPSFGIGIALAFIVILDATSLRRQIGLHAAELNRMNDQKHQIKLRETVGHKPVEIFVGLLVGAFTAFLLSLIFKFIT